MKQLVMRQRPLLVELLVIFSLVAAALRRGGYQDLLHLLAG